MGIAGERWGELDYSSVLSQWIEYQQFRSEFAKVLDLNYYPLEWLDIQVMTGGMVLFTTADSAILASIKTYPSGLKEVHGEVAVGNLETIRSQLIPQAEAYGRLHGCEIAVIESRAGWVKAMHKDGYELHQTSIRKVL